MTQPAVSQTIALLEEQYQTKLFDRFPRRLELTESGRVLKEAAQNMVRFSDETEERMRSNDENATVRIGVNLSVGKVLIHEFLSQFRVNRPQAQVRINATRGAALCDLLKKGVLDFLLMEETEEEDFIQEPFFKDRIVIVAAPDHAVWDRYRAALVASGIRLADLAGERFFLREKGAGVREQFDHLIQAHGLKIDAAWESSSTGILVNALLHGEDGIAVLPYLLIRDELAEGNACEQEMIREIYDTICDVVCFPRKQITIKGTSYPWQVVKSQFLKLKPVHIANLLERLVDNSLEINNMESYLISTLYAESLSGTLKEQADLHDDYLRYLRGNPYQNIQ